MAKKVEFFFDYISPATYFAHRLLPGIAKRTGAEIVYRPFLLGAVFKATGNSSPASIPAKGKWLIRDLNRFGQKYDIPFAMNPYFPFTTINLMRGAIWAQEIDRFSDYSDAMFKAVWAEQRNMGDEQVVSQVLHELALHPDDFLKAVSRQDIKDTLRENTDEAVRRGAFGAPSMFIDDELFWGQDRLDFVEEALKKPIASP